ncbi:MAG: thioredoxin-disulfide reductase [Alphaproteobacteria bacterium]|jgi:thioredoxin reductase (NADPH)|nr:thioredoxin-disulfide reductase [Alphaproteobacteria bacterium]
MNDQASSNNGIEKLIIIGSGPAAWTAAIYAARAELDPLVVEGLPKQNPSLVLPGGQLMLTTEVENYPGYPEGVDGPKMMEQFKDQATRFDTRVMSADVTRCDFGDWPFTLAAADSSANTSELQAHAVIIATGATANWLGLDNEQRLAMSGGGVSACAVCDGALPAFRDQHLVVVGGGDTAMEEALYLAKFASKVSIIHRRDQLRASKVMQERALGHERIEVVWNSVVTDVLGDEFITGVKLEDTQTGEQSQMKCRGMFVAIGHTPATQFLEDTGLNTDDKGYLLLEDGCRSYTNIEGVFAAGDVCDSTYRQAVTAAGMGCRAAIDAERWLGKQGIGE